MSILKFHFIEVSHLNMLDEGNLTHPLLLPPRTPDTPHRRCIADTGLGKRGIPRRWDLRTAARIYTLHTSMRLDRCTTCRCLPDRRLYPGCRRSSHQSSHHRTGICHRCTALGLRTLCWGWGFSLGQSPSIRKTHQTFILPVFPFRTVKVSALAVSPGIFLSRVFSLVTLAQALHAAPSVAANGVVRSLAARVILLCQWTRVVVAPLSSVRFIALTPATH